MTTDKRGISALLLQRQLGLRRYETAWMLLHKLRRSMVNVAREPLHGEVEIDDTWVGGPQAGLRGSRQLKGRKAAIVVTAVENRGGVTGRIRMAVIPNFKQTTMIDVVRQHVSLQSTVHTDGLKGFEDLQAAGVKQVRSTQPLRSALRQGAASVVPLADRAIGNLQQWLIGTYHGVGNAQLQVFLDEFRIFGTIDASNRWRPFSCSASGRDAGGSALQRQPGVPQTLYCWERWPGRKGPSCASSALICSMRRWLAA
jgi:transposase-like protein